MNLLQTLELNNAAVLLFHAQDYDKATSKFHQALFLMQDTMQSPPATPNMMPESPLKAAYHHLTISHDSYIETPESMFLYLRPLAMQEIGDPQPAAAIAVFCCVILFNSAVLFHQKGIIHHKMHMIDRAQKLYDGCLFLLEGQDLSNDMTFLVAVAASNNMAQIELEKGMVCSVNDRLRTMGGLIRGSRKRVREMFSSREIEGFFLNVALGGRQLSAPSA
ncbi:MAG: hypothetical protein SGBAC_010123 [Bacillariaceae sp.]